MKILPAACGSRVHPDRLHHEKISSFIFRRHLPPTPLLLRPFIGRRCGIGCRRLSSIRRYPRLSSQTVCRVAWDVRTASYQTYRRGNLEQCASHYCRIKANNKLMRLMIWIGSMKTHRWFSGTLLGASSLNNVSFKRNLVLRVNRARQIRINY